MSSVVRQVPMFVPRMMPRVREKSISLAFTEAMVITVTAEELCKEGGDRSPCDETVYGRARGALDPLLPGGAAQWKRQFHHFHAE